SANQPKPKRNWIFEHDQTCCRPLGRYVRARGSYRLPAFEIGSPGPRTGALQLWTALLAYRASALGPQAWLASVAVASGVAASVAIASGVAGSVAVASGVAASVAVASGVTASVAIA